MHNNNQNPFGHNNPYGNNNNGKSPWDDNGAHEQRKLEQERVKQGYKKDAERGFDEIVATIKYAEHNQTEVVLNEVNKSSIVRYFKRYWDNKFLSIAFLIMLIVGILSFFTKYVSFGILVVVVMKHLYSQSSFTRYYLNDSDIHRDYIPKIENMIFGYQIDTYKMFIIAFVFTVISFVISFYSVNILIEPTMYPKLLKFLSQFGSFSITNELYAYVNVLFILILMILKTIEKWKK